MTVHSIWILDTLKTMQEIKALNQLHNEALIFFVFEIRSTMLTYWQRNNTLSTAYIVN